MTTTYPLALVTGASRGIGYELAREFADRGYDVVMAAEDTAVEAAADRNPRPGHGVGAGKVCQSPNDGDAAEF
ncbi:SDR family NAD(P)-dependent oxidoreductase [Nocardia farcinica]|uniref:SDR family NAD(P)-dependent oxidoreductase n=1 Tax=Nocardia farcinica TaxID=37329 RepID=UPI003CC7D88B